VTTPMERFAQRFDISAYVPATWRSAVATGRFQPQNYSEAASNGANGRIILAGAESDVQFDAVEQDKSNRNESAASSERDSVVEPDLRLLEYWLTGGQSNRMATGLSASASFPHASLADASNPQWRKRPVGTLPIFERLQALLLRAFELKPTGPFQGFRGILFGLVGVLMLCALVTPIVSLLKSPDPATNLDAAFELASTDAQPNAASPSSLPLREAPAKQGSQMLTESVSSITPTAGDSGPSNKSDDILPLASAAEPTLETFSRSSSDLPATTTSSQSRAGPTPASTAECGPQRSGKAVSGERSPVADGTNNAINIISARPAAAEAAPNDRPAEAEPTPAVGNTATVETHDLLDISRRTDLQPVIPLPRGRPKMIHPTISHGIVSTKLPRPPAASIGLRWPP
jgi:hypothetical protein